MATTVPHVRFRLFGILVLGACLALPAPAQDGLKTKVKIVEVTVTKDGDGKVVKVSVDQQKVRLKKNQDIVIWVTDGESMTITWKAGNPPPGNPLPRLTCAGRFCGTLVPSDAPPGVYYYTVKVDGKSLDPDVEVGG